MKRNSKTDGRKVATFLATLAIITLPIAQLNVFAFTNSVPPEQVVEKLSAKTLAKFVGDDPWGSTATGGTILPAGGDGPSKNALDQESPAQGIDGEKQDEKSSENKDKNQQSTDSKEEDKASSGASSNSNQQSGSSSNNNNGSSGNSSSGGGNNSSSSNSNSSGSNNNSSNTTPEPTGHWEQQLVKAAWTETVTTTQYRCMCGQIFDSPAAWQAHRPNP